MSPLLAPINLRRYSKALTCITLLTAVTYGSVDIRGAQNNFDQLLKERKYYSAAELLSTHKELLGEPALLRRYIDLLTNYFIFSFNGSVFALKDLESDETVEKLRGHKGTFKSVSLEPAPLLVNALGKYPNSADVHFAVGQYLSFMDTHFSTVGVPEFKNPNQEFESFLFAYNKGVYDWWSLFRLACHRMRDASMPLDPALQWLLKSWELKPDHVDMAYDLAVIYYLKKDYKNALDWVDKVVGRYGDDFKLSGDAYHLKAKILLALNRRTEAEAYWIKALEVYPGHEEAFEDLLAFYRPNEPTKYKELILKNVKRDYSNTLFLNYYLDYLDQAGRANIDVEVEDDLLALPVKTDQEIGALYFCLGKLALMRDDKIAANKRLKRALSAIQMQPKPPEGSIEATKALLAKVHGSEKN